MFLLQAATPEFVSTAVDTAKAVVPNIQTANTPTDTLNFFELIAKGGWIMIPIGILFLVTLYIIIERLLYLGKVGKIDNNLMSVVKDNLVNSNINGAQTYCIRNNSSQYQVIGTGIEFIGQNMRDVESAMEDKTNIELQKMDHSVSYLGLIAGIAPMMGFIGTIAGVIKIFYDISLSDNISIGNISEGLYMKMITSASGLVVGIFAYTAFQLLQSRIDNISRKIQENVLQLKSILNQPGS